MRDWLLESSVARAKQEHEWLKEELGSIYDQACGVRRESDARGLDRKMRQLREGVKRFLKHWNEHTEWEDHELFPQAAYYLGAEPDTFVLMEQEYELAEQNIRIFLQALDRAVYPIGKEEARNMSAYLIQAYAMLNNRFREEDEMMAELANGLQSPRY